MGANEYVLGVDLGTTFTAAAVARPGAPATPVPLGSRSMTMPSVLYLGPDGELLVGDAAERRALSDPSRVARRFKRRIGDDTPLLIGADSYPAHTLTARMIAWVVTQVTQRQGCAPSELAVTHPASWGSHKLQLLSRALTDAGLTQVRLISEPMAAAFAYAQSGRLPVDATVAVYDLGGGTFDACLLQAVSPGHFVPVGVPVGLPNLGGIDFDDAVLGHVLDALGSARADLDPTDPMVVTALTRLRRECVDAKEALSTDTAASVPVLLGGLATNVRITRAEFEALIAPGIAATVEAMEAAIDSAHPAADQLRHLLLVGGSSRIPLVAQALSARLNPAVRLEHELDPKLAVAMGAALFSLAAANEALQAGSDALTGGAGGPAPFGAAALAAPGDTPARSGTNPAGGDDARVGARMIAPPRPANEVIELSGPPCTPEAQARSRRTRRGLVAVGCAAAAAVGVLGHGLWAGDPTGSFPTVGFQQARPPAASVALVPAPTGSVPMSGPALDGASQVQAPSSGRSAAGPGGAVVASPTPAPAPPRAQRPAVAQQSTGGPVGSRHTPAIRPITPVSRHAPIPPRSTPSVQYVDAHSNRPLILWAGPAVQPATPASPANPAAAAAPGSPVAPVSPAAPGGPGGTAGDNASGSAEFRSDSAAPPPAAAGSMAQAAPRP